MEPSVLLIDTDPAELRAVADLLEDAGFGVVSASTFQEVHAAIGREAPPVVVVEPVMSGIDGYELCRAIRRVFPDYEPTIFVASRHVRGQGPASKTDEIGAKMFLERPTMDQQLIQEISASLDRVTSARETALVRRSVDEVEIVDATPVEWSAAGTALVSTESPTAARGPAGWKYLAGMIVMTFIGAGLGAWFVSRLPATEPLAAGGRDLAREVKSPPAEAVAPVGQEWVHEDSPQPVIGLGEPPVALPIPPPTPNGMALIQREPQRAPAPAPERTASELPVPTAPVASQTSGETEPRPAEVAVVAVAEAPLAAEPAATTVASRLDLDEPPVALTILPPAPNGIALQPREAQRAPAPAPERTASELPVPAAPAANDAFGKTAPPPVEVAEAAVAESYVAAEPAATTVDSRPAPSLGLDQAVPDPAVETPSILEAEVPQPPVYSRPPVAAAVAPPAIETPPVVDSAPPVIQAPRLIQASRVEPRYPMVARRLRVGGAVKLRAYVAVDGTVARTEILEDPSRKLGLGKAAAAAVQRWRYEPAEQNGQPVEATIDVDISFVP